MTEPDRLVGERRCWPCTVANTVVAALVAGVPLLAALLGGEPVLVVAAVAWAIAVVGYTLYRLLALGYLPGSEHLAKRIGLHDRVGPERADDRIGPETSIDRIGPDRTESSEESREPDGNGGS